MESIPNTDRFQWSEPTEDADGAVWLRFSILGGNLSHESLSAITLPPGLAAGRPIVFSGRAPNWLLCRLVLLAQEAGAPWIGCDTARAQAAPDGSTNVVRFAGSPPVVSRHSAQPGYDVVEVMIHDTTMRPESNLRLERLGEITLPDVPHEPDDGIVLCGQLPTVLYVHLARKAAARYAWVAVSNMQLPNAAACVVWSRTESAKVGGLIETAAHLQVGVFSAAAPGERKQNVLAVVGGRKSGKSVLSYGLNSVTRGRNGVWVYRANPDAEGDYLQETSPAHGESFRQQLKQAAGGWTAEFARQQATMIKSLRPKSDLLIVDLAGKCSPELEEILGECTHALLLVKDDDAENLQVAEQFREACKRWNVRLLGHLTSNLHGEQTEVQVTDGYLNGTVARLERYDRTVVDRCRPLWTAIAKLLGMDERC